MNESKYNQLLLRMMRKVPDSYRGYVNTEALDRAYAEDQTRKDLTYNRLADMRKENQRNVDLAGRKMDLSEKGFEADTEMFKRRMDADTSQFNQAYGFREDQIDDAQNNMTIANLISGAGVGVNFLQGMNQRRANQRIADLLKSQTAYWNSMA